MIKPFRRITAWTFVAVVLGLLQFGRAAQNRTDIDLSGPGWKLWRDEKAQWRNDTLFLPPVDISKLPVNVPTGGWEALESPAALDVSVPGTAEEYLQKLPGPQAAAELNGVTWWHRRLQIPAASSPRKILLRFEATRQRAEVFVNRRLVGYDLIGNTPYDVDISSVVRPGDAADLDVRITNPGGNYDWHDKGLINWGRYRILFGHGFGGITGRVTLLICDPIYIDDLYVQNLPAMTDVNAFVTVNNTTPAAVTRDLTIDVLERNGSDHAIASAQSRGVKLAPGPNSIPLRVSAPQAKLWDPDHPNLYVCRATLSEPGADAIDDSAAKTFGFRWFEPVGIGSNAMFRLNGKRIVLRSAISWGLFPINGIIATPEMAEKQIRAAKAFGLNMLNFHRCIGQPIILEKADELGLLYYEEPGNYDNGGNNPVARAMAHEKVLRMVQRDRSHPSLIIYCMSNETAASGAQLQMYESDMTQMHQLDPSRILTRSSGLRSVIGIDKPLSTKVHFRPFDSTLYDTGWYDDHHSGGPETWTQADYRGPNDFYHHIDDDPEIQFWGEEGAISTPPRLGLIKEELQKSSHLGWDGQMYLDWYKMFDQFLTEKHLRDAFPTVDSLCESMGNIALEHQGRKTELMRIGNSADAYVINGWDAEIIENHSGIVDAFRNPKGDPSILAYYNQPLYVAVMVRRQIVEVPGKVAVDFYIVNEKNLHGPHRLQVTASDPAGHEVFDQTFNVNLAGGDTYGQRLVADVEIPVPASAIGAFTINARILDPAGREMATGHDSILGVDWKSDKLAGTGAILDSGSRLRRFFEHSEGMKIADYSDGLPRLDWVVVAGAPDRAGPELVPAAQLRDPTGQKPGLLATYFNDMSFSQKAVEHIDETVDASAPEGAMIDPAVSTLSNYSVRWEGRIIAPISGDYAFTLQASGTASATVDAQRVASAGASPARGAPPAPRARRITLEAGKPVPIKIEWSQGAGMGTCRLLWTLPITSTPPSSARLLDRVRDDGTTLIVLENAADWMPLIQKAVPEIKYHGAFMVGRTWAGGDHFVRRHPLFKDLPVNQGMNWQYQAVVRAGNSRFGLLIDGDELVAGAFHANTPETNPPEPIHLGTAVGVIACGKGKIIVNTLDIAGNLAGGDGPDAVAKKLLCNFIDYAGAVPSTPKVAP